MNVRRLALVVAGLFAAVPAVAVTPGVAVGSSQYSIGVVGYVPVICRANVDATVVAPMQGMVQLGTLHEFCNSPNGYRIYAEYSASLANANILIDGKAVQLQPGGSTMISQSSSAAIDNHALALAVPEGVTDGTISFRIQAN
ncbi:MAG: hypothetical protein RLZZ84_1136 [Pseudomonadota bacterium]|jgi:hypothetical protein